MMIVHDQSEAISSSTNTLFTIQSARRNSETTEMPLTSGAPPVGVTSTLAVGAAAGGASSWVCASCETGAARGVRCAKAEPLGTRNSAAAITTARCFNAMHNPSVLAGFALALFMPGTRRPAKLLEAIGTWPNLGAGG